MCRSIKILRRPEEPATPEEVSQAALQFVRKISGYNKPSKANQELGWKPEVGFEELVTEMVREDLKLAERELKLLR